MRWRDERKLATRLPWSVVSVMLLLAVIIGAVARPATWLRALSTTLSEPIVTAPAIGVAFVPAGDDLVQTMEIQIHPDDWSRLAADAERGMQRQQLTLRDEENAALVPAQIRWTGQEAWITASARLKGDWTDHLQGAFWSMRITLPAKAFFHGMQVFSIQVPETRNFLGEWLLNESARSMGVLAPRGGFVRTIINGQARGPAYWEEHPAKQLLESQRRREGPVVALGEEPLWKARLQMGRAGMTGMTGMQVEAASDPVRADPVMIGRFSWRQRPAMAAQVDHGLAAMEGLQHALVARHRDPTNRDAAAAWVQGHIDRPIAARALALCSLFVAQHGVSAWHNLRFYHNPITGLLEPVLFDNWPHGGPARAEVATEWSGEWPTLLMADAGYQEYFWKELSHLINDETMNRTLDRHLNSEMAMAYERLLAGTGAATREFWRQALAERRAHLAALLDPQEPLGVRSVRLTAGGDDPGTISVEAWAHTRRPMAVSWIESSNGVRLDAAKTVQGDVQYLPDGSVLIPGDGMRVTFLLPADARLEGLADTSQMKRQIRAVDAERRSPPLRVRWRLLGGGERITEVEARPVQKGWREPGLPPAPSLQQFLSTHPGWVYDVASQRLTAPAGAWRIDQDLITPVGVPVTVPAGSDWAIAPDIIIVVRGALHLNGTQQQPVVLQRADPTRPWSGLVVLGDQHPSSWSWVIIGGAKASSRGWWSLTGATTIHHSPVTMRDCRFTGSESEDQVNIIDTTFDFERVSIAKSPSDLLDADFADGRIVDCDFADSGEDAIDVSESRIVVERCRFDRIGDKACSIGENSRADLTDITIGSAVIGVASKDHSQVHITGIRINAARVAGLAAYIKKPEWGSSNMEATAVHIGGAPRWLALCQTGCRMVVNGQVQTPQPLDIDQLYRDKVLGQ